MNCLLKRSTRSFTKLVRPPHLPEIKNDKELEQIIRKNKTCIIYVNVPWCNDCNSVSPYIRNISFKNKYPIYSCGINVGKKYQDKYTYERKVPMFMYFNEAKLRMMICTNYLKDIEKDIVSFIKNPKYRANDMGTIAVKDQEEAELNIPMHTVKE